MFRRSQHLSAFNACGVVMHSAMHAAVPTEQNCQSYPDKTAAHDHSARMGHRCFMGFWCHVVRCRAELVLDNGHWLPVMCKAGHNASPCRGCCTTWRSCARVLHGVALSGEYATFFLHCHGTLLSPCFPVLPLCARGHIWKHQKQLPNCRWLLPECNGFCSRLNSVFLGLNQGAPWLL